MMPTSFGSSSAGDGDRAPQAPFGVATDMFHQADIYDERYRAGSYDRRSAVRVLTAESDALVAAVRRAIQSNPGLDPVTMLDFGYGTGRVTNDFALAYPSQIEGITRDLSIVAYDVSGVGLRNAADALIQHGFSGARELAWRQHSESGYAAGSLRRTRDGATVTVTFVHGSEASPIRSTRLLLAGGSLTGTYLVTTSWYSAIGHIFGTTNRQAVFRLLGTLTNARGELLVAVSGTGDLVEEQKEWQGWRDLGFPIEGSGDVIYKTELGKPNYYHVFGVELNELLDLVTGPEHEAWLEALRFPDAEFNSLDEEMANYDRVRRFNRDIGRRRWTDVHFAQVHTVLAVRSGWPSWTSAAAADDMK
jgi:hypothetical protein